MRLVIFAVIVGICALALLPHDLPQVGANEIFAIKVPDTTRETGHA